MSSPMVLGLRHNKVIRDWNCRDRRNQITKETAERNIVILDIQTRDTYRDKANTQNDKTARDPLLCHYFYGNRQRRRRDIWTMLTRRPVLQEEHQTPKAYHTQHRQSIRDNRGPCSRAPYRAAHNTQTESKEESQERGQEGTFRILGKPHIICRSGTPCRPSTYNGRHTSADRHSLRENIIPNTCQAAWKLRTFPDSEKSGKKQHWESKPVQDDHFWKSHIVIRDKKNRDKNCPDFDIDGWKQSHQNRAKHRRIHYIPANIRDMESRNSHSYASVGKTGGQCGVAVGLISHIAAQSCKESKE